MNDPNTNPLSALRNTDPNGLQGNIFAQADTIEQVVAQAVGYGSVCWLETGTKGCNDFERVFDSNEASKAVDCAVQRIKELLGLDIVITQGVTRLGDPNAPQG